MRIVSSKAVAGIIEVRLDSPGADHPMKARVVWCKKLGFRLYEVGLEFTDRKAVAHVVEWISVWTGKKGAA